MSVVACDMYRIEVSQDQILPILVELELIDVFEPVKPLFPVNTKMYQQLLQVISTQRERAAQAIEVLPNRRSSAKNQDKLVLTVQLSQKIQKHMQFLEKIVADILEKQEQIVSLHKEIEFTNTQKEKLDILKDISLPVYGSSDLVNSTVLVVDRRKFPVFERSLQEIDLIEMHILAETTEALFLAVVYDQEFAARITDLTDKPYCHELALSNEVSATSPAQAYKEYDDRMQELLATIELTKDDLKMFSKEYSSELIGYHDLLLLQERSLRTLEYVGYTLGSNTNTRSFSREMSSFLLEKNKTDDTVVSGLSNQENVHIDGWIDPTQVSFLRDRLTNLEIDVRLTQLDVTNDPEVRTVLRNNRLLRPFEVITNLMGTPHTTEIDPSAYVAPFFILFFGFALGDAGYGLLMVATVMYFYRKRHAYSRQLRNVLGLMLYCGVSTTAFGILTGGWFGLDLGSIGQAGEFLGSLKILDVQSNIILLLVVSLITGFIHQLFGLLLAMKQTWQNGRISEALQVPGTWLLFLLSIGFTFAVYTTPQLESFAHVAQSILGVSTFVFILGQGYGSSWWVRPFKGMLSLFNLTSYLSNTLSYARLLALALATGVIASVVNMIAVMAAGDLPFVLWVIVVTLVAVIGHAANIALNLMGTFINVARLHLVEFFPKFFEAKGSSLNPLHNEPTYSFFAENFSTKDISFDQFKVQTSNK